MEEQKKHAGGRPLKFKSPKELEDRIDAYFKNCDELNEPYLVTGLALWLDTTRETILDYQNRDEYSDSIKKAKLKVESFAERKLYNEKLRATGPIFALKNFGWKDRTELDATVRTPKPILDALSNNNGNEESIETK